MRFATACHAMGELTGRDEILGEFRYEGWSDPVATKFLANSATKVWRDRVATTFLANSATEVDVIGGDDILGEFRYGWRGGG